jgi:hypothetical protein
MSTSVALIHVCLECFFSLKYVLVSQNMILIPIRANQQMQQSDNIAWWIRWSGRWIFSLVVDSEAQAWDCGRWGTDLAIPLGGGAAVLAGNVDVCEAARGRWGLDLAIPPPPPFPFWRSCGNRRWSKVMRVVSPRCCGNCRWPKAMCMIALYNGGPLPSSTHQEKRDNLHRCCCSSTPSVIGRSHMR